MKEIIAKIKVFHGLNEETSTSWEYELPTDMIFSKTKQQKSINIPIIGDTKIIGYAVTGYYAIAGDIYDNRDDAYNNPYYQGETACPFDSAIQKSKIQQQQEDDDCYGD